MTRMTRGIGQGIVDGLLMVFGEKRTSGGLVRMFETEYSKEARFARRAGLVIDDNFVRSFLATQAK